MRERVAMSQFALVSHFYSCNVVSGIFCACSALPWGRSYGEGNHYWAGWFVVDAIGVRGGISWAHIFQYACIIICWTVWCVLILLLILWLSRVGQNISRMEKKFCYRSFSCAWKQIDNWSCDSRTTELCSQLNCATKQNHRMAATLPQGTINDWLTQPSFDVWFRDKMFVESFL